MTENKKINLWDHFRAAVIGCAAAIPTFDLTYDLVSGLVLLPADISVPGAYVAAFLVGVNTAVFVYRASLIGVGRVGKERIPFPFQRLT